MLAVHGGAPGIVGCPRARGTQAKKAEFVGGKIDPGQEGVAFARLACGHHRCARGRQRSTACCSTGGSVDARSSRSTSRAARRSSSRRSSRAARRSPTSSSTRPCRSSASASTRAVSPRRRSARRAARTSSSRSRASPDDGDDRPHRVLGEARVPPGALHGCRGQQHRADSSATPAPDRWCDARRRRRRLADTPDRGARPTRATRTGSRRRSSTEYRTSTARRSTTPNANVAPADEPLVTCDDVRHRASTSSAPSRCLARRITDARAARSPTARASSTGVWGVNIDFDDEGTKQFAEVTERLYGLPRHRRCATASRSCSTARSSRLRPPRASSPTASRRSAAPSRRRRPRPSPTSSSSALCRSASRCRATTRSRRPSVSSQLLSGLIAGLIGLILVVIYSLVQYRALGLGDDRLARHRGD